MEKENNINNSGNQGRLFLKMIVVVAIIALLIIIVLGEGNSGKQSTSSSNGQQRCWYCSKVIFNNGRPIHARHEYIDTYSCEYCGKKNVKN